jgi:trimethylamine---corrinoid protein Co-methyltransferase
LYQKARYALMEMDISSEDLALDTIDAVGAGGHYLAQKHTRVHMRDAMKRGVCHQLASDGSYQDPRQYAIDQTRWILANHHPEPLESARLAELDRILASADRELN